MTVGSAPTHPNHADKEARQHSLETQGCQGCARNNEAHGLGIIQSSVARLAPYINSCEQQSEAEHQGASSDEEPSFQVHQLKEASHARILRQQPFADSKRLGENG